MLPHGRLRPGWDIGAPRVAGDALVAGRETDTYSEITTPVLFVQAFNQSTEHRTQILSRLCALGAGPADFDSEIDGWSWGYASGEMTEKGR